MNRLSKMVIFSTGIVFLFSSVFASPVHADKKTAVTGEVTTTFEFSDEYTKDAKKWFDHANEVAREDLEKDLKEAPKKEKPKIKKAIKFLEKNQSDKVFKEYPDGSSELNQALAGMEVKIGKQKTTTNRAGKYTIPQVPLGKHKLTISYEGHEIHSMDVVVKRGQPRKDIDLQIYDRQFIESARKMSESMASHHQEEQVGTQEVTTYPELPQGEEVGEGRGSMVILTEEGNIVNCNKAHAYESPQGKKPFDPAGQEDWKSDTASFPWTEADCAVSIALGFQYLMAPFFLSKYDNSYYCVLESMNAIPMDPETPEKNIYCNGENKDGKYNCSWFEGIDHDEALHTH
ncbi:carboxypeptidase-like regulatory domain-containing protein [Desmospora activa]|uniref:Carboxypeptidase family protein n=1 Tax=Desmospora activa DSM 45169 TaxID=1121389 RepID=A0A2T4ZDH1_9BACL|nr:carboxypeptidase-like regulatory domain-containing protein [Desmospora activa]PTM59948.1 carboxypeptidase family protein [Desmospora activa DSM 45169]